MKWSVGLLILLHIAVSRTSHGVAPRFTPIGETQDGLVSYAPLAIAGDGSVVAGDRVDITAMTGFAETTSFYWTEREGALPLGELPGRSNYSSATGVSYDGSTIVGTAISDQGYQAFRWTPELGMHVLPDIPSESTFSSAYNVSGNGEFITGWARIGDDAYHFRWSEPEGLRPLASPMGGVDPASAAGISHSGEVVAGYGRTTRSRTEAYRWTPETGTVAIGDLPGGTIYSIPEAVSADGSTVVGYSSSDVGLDAFRWTAVTGMQSLGFLPGPFRSMFPYDVSGDGNTVVGFANGDEEEAFWWTTDSGMTSVRSVLESAGLSEQIEGWDIRRATAISDDGLTVAGTGHNPDGDFQGWIAVIPEPAAALCPPAVCFLLRRRRGCGSSRCTP